MVWMFALLLACGGDEDSAESVSPCDAPFKACGGDVKGAWTMDGVCDLGMEAEDFGCESATVVVIADRSTGSVDLRPDGSFVRIYDVDADFEVALPISCVGSCAGLIAASDGLLESCEDKDGACSCRGTRVVKNEAEGTWFTSGSEVITNTDRRTKYCVDGENADTVDDQGLRALWSR